MNNLHRVFVAINLPPDVRQKLSVREERWPELPAKWTRVENLHVTLVFLGNANDQEVVEICKTVSEISGKHEPFVLELNRICYGPQGKTPPRMVWAVGPKSDELGNLQDGIENALYDMGRNNLEKNGTRAFAPHVTLARLNQFGIRKMDIEEVPDISEDVSHKFLVESIEVMESELKRGGPVYTVLESARLGEEI